MFHLIIMQSLGSYPWLPSFPSFLCIFETLKPCLLSLGPFLRLELHSPTLSCHLRPPPPAPTTDNFLNHRCILTDLGSCCCNYSAVPSPRKEGLHGQLVAAREVPRIMTQSGVRNQSPLQRKDLEIHSKLMKPKQEEQGKIYMGDGREVWDLVLPSSLSADVPFTLCLQSLARTRTESYRKG